MRNWSTENLTRMNLIFNMLKVLVTWCKVLKPGFTSRQSGSRVCALNNCIKAPSTLLQRVTDHLVITATRVWITWVYGLDIVVENEFDVENTTNVRQMLHFSWQPTKDTSLSQDLYWSSLQGTVFDGLGHFLKIAQSALKCYADSSLIPLPQRMNLF